MNLKNMIGSDRKNISVFCPCTFLEVLRELWKILLRKGGFRVDVLSWELSNGK
jgi:hypothetical protein